MISSIPWQSSSLTAVVLFSLLCVFTGMFVRTSYAGSCVNAFTHSSATVGPTAPQLLIQALSFSIYEHSVIWCSSQEFHHVCVSMLKILQ